jgi:SAM-dependent methyltransferase
MAAGSIIIDLLMKTGSFETDTKRAEKSLKQLAKSAKDSAKGIRDSFAGNLLADFVGGIVRDIGRLPKAMLDSVDALNDVADATGAAIEKISALEDIGARTGSSMDVVTTALIKFNDSLKDTDPKSNAAEALKRIGLNAEELRKLDPADALHKTAKALAEFADDGDKARLVQELFGRSTRQTAAFLKDLADKGELNATVTTEQAKQAEAFNQQLMAMQKNISDIGRSILSDLLPSLNEWATILKEGGILAFLHLGGGAGAASSNIGATIEDVTKRLKEMKTAAEQFEKANPLAKLFSAEDQAARKLGITTMEGQLRALKALQAQQALGGVGDTSDALSRRLGSMNRPSVGPGPKPAGPKGKDPDADFKAYMSNLQEQIQKTHELTVTEKLLDDIRRGTLSVSPKQEAALKTLAVQIDTEKEAMAVAKERQEQRNKDYQQSIDAARELDEADRAWLRTLTDDTPTRKMEQLLKDLERLDKALENGLVDPQVHQEARNKLVGLGDAAKETENIGKELGLTFTSALEEAAIAGGDLQDVMKGLLQDLIKIFFRLTVTEPLLKQFSEAFKDTGGGSQAGGFFKSLLGSVVGAFTGGAGGGSAPVPAGAKAGGGDVLPGRSYDVGEYGRERFTPRTAGTISPAGSMGSGNLHVVNQTTGHVDRAVEKRISGNDRAIILQENLSAFRAELYDAGSKTSRAVTQNFTTSRRR